jgi:hypothetical protein
VERKVEENAMTIEAAVIAGIKWLRKPYWMPTVKLELPPAEPGSVKANEPDTWPYCVLHDHRGNTHRIPIFSVADDQDDWEQVI